MVISGDEVRSWTTAERAEVQTRLAASTNNDVELTTENFALQLAAVAMQNDSIKEITTADNETEVKFETEIKLFGFIPIKTTATIEVEGDGEVEVDYPWYAFLALKSDTPMLQQLAIDIQQDFETLVVSDASISANRDELDIDN